MILSQLIDLIDCETKVTLYDDDTAEEHGTWADCQCNVPDELLFRPVTFVYVMNNRLHIHIEDTRKYTEL